MKTPPAAPALTQPFPWASVCVIAFTLGVAAQPALAPTLLYERLALLRGEYWRLWTSHFVHFGSSHLFWNLAIFTVASIWSERLAPARTRLLLVASLGLIGLALFGLEPALATYGGLSGVATSMLVFLCYTQLARLAAAPATTKKNEPMASSPTSDRWFWRAVLALVLLKIGAEFALEQPLFTRFAPAGIRAVPLAHLIGVLVATIMHRNLRGFRPRFLPRHTG